MTRQSGVHYTQEQRENERHLNKTKQNKEKANKQCIVHSSDIDLSIELEIDGNQKISPLHWNTIQLNRVPFIFSRKKLKWYWHWQKLDFEIWWLIWRGEIAILVGWMEIDFHLFQNSKCSDRSFIHRKLLSHPTRLSSLFFTSYALFQQRNHIYTFHIQWVSHCETHTKWANVFNYSENLVKGNERNGSEWNKLQTCKINQMTRQKQVTITQFVISQAFQFLFFT